MSLSYQFKLLVLRSREGSHLTQRNRIDRLGQMADQLHNAGLRLNHPAGLKQKHVDALVKGWRDEKLSARTVDNRLSDLRWVCEKHGKTNLMHQDNAFYRGEPEKRIAPEGKSLKPDWGKWSALPEKTLANRCAKASVALTWMAGARFKASIMSVPNRTGEGILDIRQNEDKNGRPNLLDYRTELEGNPSLVTIEKYVKAVSNEAGGRLIPSDKDYIQQRKHVEYLIAKHGFGGCHARRHDFAREFYERRVGEEAANAGIIPWGCPVNGGPQELQGKEAEIDKGVRQELAEHLGHNRIGITRSYIG